MSSQSMDNKKKKKKKSKQKKAPELPPPRIRGTQSSVYASSSSSFPSFQLSPSAFLDGTVESIITTAEQEIITDPSKASVMLKQILSVKNDYIPAIDLMAECCLAEGDQASAFQYYQQSCSLAPEENPSKWLSIAQLMNGGHSVQAYSQAIKLLGVEKNALDEKKKKGGEIDEEEITAESSAICRQISSAYASIAELYMQEPLCDSEGAEQQCENAIAAALQISDTNLDALYSFANLRFIQRRIEESEAAALSAYQLAQQKLSEYDAQGITAVPDESAGFPSFITRFSLAKLLLEQQKFSEASHLLERLLQEDDTVIELWYIAGVCAFNENDYNTSLEYIQRALAMLAKCSDDEDTVMMRNNLLSLQESVQKELEEHEANGGMEEVNEDEDEEDEDDGETEQNGNGQDEDDMTS